MLRIVNGVDPITGTEISNQERLRSALLMFMRFSVSRNSAKEVEKEETEELNFFEKSINSFKEIGQDVWNGLENRADKMFDSPYDFANYLTLGLPDGLKGTWEGAKVRSEKATDSFYDFFNYLSFGNVGMINGAINTDDPFSKEHWLNSFGVLTLATGPASLVTKAGKPKSINTPETGNTTKALEGIQKETKEFFTDVKNGGTIFVNELSNLINRSLFPHQDLQMSMANQMPVNVFSRTAIEDRIDSVVSSFVGDKNGTRVIDRSNRLIPGKIGVVTGGDSTKLGKNMLVEMGLKRSTKWSGYQAQHIIPSEMAKNEVIKKIGMDFDDASNGIFLRVPDNDISTMSRHRGYHSVYNQVVERALNKMDINQSVDSLQKQVYELQQNLKKLQEKGLPLYPAQGATIELWERKLRQLGI